MKKFILLVIMSSTFIMCKKSEAATSQIKNAVSSADSTVANVSETINSANEDATAIFDSASINIKDFENTKSEADQKIESTSKSIDSLSDKIANMKLESKINSHKDSLDKKNERIVVNVPAPKIIKETKIIYKDKTKSSSENLQISKNKMQKTGVLEINVNNAETAKEIVKEQVKKYDGFISSENVSLNNNDTKTAYLRVKVPIQKFDYLMDDLSYNIGEIENKSIDASGQDFINNILCDVEITLYSTDSDVALSEQPKSFDDRSFAAVSSGWDVITSIFLFFLPLWPIFLIAGAAYYFYKKKKNNLPGN
ncbi:DUF4349 domain-containing protein [Chryseobacterium wangxinyae]|uniref:DUF4349 domain-containing protein n=1 Tax=Chryseobacterium sp. CY353 TaxID=2997334 RepID=UPI002271FA16|nr:DUF4349 domain-containing protein [Chryseobacterium sp. CY353]MCY0968013.1 DUF4349 domain-containing protein [Chryseobacterium sp. CY353]